MKLMEKLMEKHNIFVRKTEKQKERKERKTCDVAELQQQFLDALQKDVLENACFIDRMLEILRSLNQIGRVKKFPNFRAFIKGLRKQLLPQLGLEACGGWWPVTNLSFVGRAGCWRAPLEIPHWRLSPCHLVQGSQNFEHETFHRSLQTCCRAEIIVTLNTSKLVYYRRESCGQTEAV